MENLRYYKNLSEKSEFFQDNRCIKTIEEFDEFYNTHSTGNTKYAYRGVSNATYKLYNSLQRDWMENQLGCKTRIENKRKRKFRSYLSFLNYLVKTVRKEKDLCSFLSGNAVDFNILALLQHYQYPSPLIDFSYNITTSLFFMTDTETDNEYCSLYFFPLNDFRLGCSLEESHQDAFNHGASVMESSYLVNFMNCPYRDIFKDISYITIKGGVENPTICTDERLDLKFIYEITNPRMSKQKGLFILNTSFSDPLEDVQQKSGYRSIRCVNINKKLISQIKNKYLHGLRSEDFYFPNNESKYIFNKFKDMEKRSLI